MKVAVIQMDIFLGKPVENLNKVEKLIRKAALENPDLIILPEMWNTSYALDKIKDIADEDGKPCAHRVGELAKELKVNIIAGSVADKREEKVYNTSYVFNRLGETVAKYSKVHLFGLMREWDYLERGKERCLFKLDGITCGLIICYDLRFPELTRRLTLDGAKIIFVPAQWPYPRLHPWMILNQARAIENQVYIVSANRVGEEGKAKFFGHSLVVDPLGEIIYQGSEQEEIKVADLDLEKVDSVRKKMTCLEDRYEEVYR